VSGYNLNSSKNERGARIKVSVNGETVPGLEQVEGYVGKIEAAKPIDLGVVKPDGNVIRIRFGDPHIAMERQKLITKPF
jgi:hypothetical protein